MAATARRRFPWGGDGGWYDRADGGDEEGEDDVSLRLGVEGGGNPLNFMRFHPQFDEVRGTNTP